MENLDPVALNVFGVQNLIEDSTNKIPSGFDNDEGIVSDEIDLLELELSDEELKELKRGYENKSAPYTGRIEPRQKQNKAYLFGTQRGTSGLNSKTVPSNILFQATATFVPQALAKNPEPVVWSDNTDEGKDASSDIKTMLQYHAETLCLRDKLGLMVWHWSVNFIAVLKYGWNDEVGDVDIQVRQPKNFVLDPDGFIDEYGDYQGEYLGERIQSTAEKLIELYPKSKEYITKDVGGKLGTLIQRTEWWNNKFSFTTYKDEVLDKHKNQFFNYDDKPNHFAIPKMPYTFLSVFSLQEQPHDFTNLIEQNQANQDQINDRDYQINKNLAHANNSLVMDDKSFTIETARQGAMAMEQGDPILGPKGSVERMPAPALPAGLLDAQERNKQNLQAIYGVQGVTAQPENQETTARGMILNQSFDNTRIGGGVGDKLERVAANAFNYLLQLYYVFYDEAHYASVMGQMRAVEYTKLIMSDTNRHFVVTVSANSMKPKDEVSERNEALELWKAGALDPLTLFKRLDFPDPNETAKQTTLYITNPQLYQQMMWPETAQQPADSANPPNPQDVTGGQPGGPPPETVSQEPASSQLSNVPLT
jgi:hypothetical protein